jgi:1,4-dihydroxy-2-naphthoate octaprenyltransferase
VELLAQAIRHLLRRHREIVAAQGKMRHKQAVVVVVAHRQQGQTHQALLALPGVTVLHQAFLEHLPHMLAAAAVVLVAPLLAEQAEQVAAEQVAAVLMLQLRLRQILAEAEAVEN